MAKSKDDWIPTTPQTKPASNRRKKTSASNRRKKAPGKAAKAKGKRSAMKNVFPNLPKILKKKKTRQAPKRISSNKLAELMKVVNDLSFYNFPWRRARRKRSNTTIRRRDFPSSSFSFPTFEDKSVEKVLQVEDKSIETVLEECEISFEEKLVEGVVLGGFDVELVVGAHEILDVECVVGSEMHVPERSKCSQPEEDSIGRDKAFDIDKLNCDGAVEQNVVAWVPPTPQIRAEGGRSVSNAAKCGQTESLIDILKRTCTRVDSEKKQRKKMIRHKPKVVGPRKPVKPTTPKPPAPKPTRKVKRKLDFNKQHSTMNKEEEEEELKHQDLADDSLNIRENKCRRVSPAELNNMIGWSCELSPSEYGTIPCNGTSTSGNSENNILLMQDEAVRDALVDFTVARMQALRIEDDTCNQLVVHDPNRSGALVVSKYPTKYRKPAIDFDKETTVAWDLLTRDDWNEDAEAEALGQDADNMKRERKFFLDRLNVFLERMHVVQGDRNFSPWKGSIVDSIVGVFLTQNVSDHLSSSAFMALVAKYPPLSLDEQNEQIRLFDNQIMVVEPSSNTTEDSSPVSSVDPQVDPGAKKTINWDDLKKQYSHGISRQRVEENSDSINWGAVRQATEAEVAKVILDRGMNNQLADRIKRFLNRLVTDHGSIDLEWLRNVPPPKAKEYLLSMSGLGLKSTECVRLLGLHFPAFPVDTNAGRFFVRVGWVPIKQLPEGVQFHELNDYPSLDSIQKYIWPRLCDKDHSLLYQTHCHSVTVAKTFCTKTRPNCNQCPMRNLCKHYASALASAKLLQGSQATQQIPKLANTNSEPIIEFPPSPVSERMPPAICDIEEIGHVSEDEDPDPVICDIEDMGHYSKNVVICDIEDMGRASEMTTVPLRGVEYPGKIRRFIDDDYGLSKVLVAMNDNIASIPLPEPKLKLRLRTLHEVYELPDSHPLLATVNFFPSLFFHILCNYFLLNNFDFLYFAFLLKFSNREYGDCYPYLLAIWRQDEHSKEATPCDSGPPCLSREVVQYQNKERITGTILVPCFTAMGGRFPLNGTYFQINEVFADYETSVEPIVVPTELIWNLNKRDLYCGTSITSICKGMSTAEVAHLFNKSSICIRGFNKKSKAAKSLDEKFHLCKTRTPSKS
ncbi:protein ROS1A-like isoform X1 [Salvia splendens]|uniref:protein ROS1A-like isoform X1 n=1 Tax=Salvia splendens TaxID=180675 RepID=UPI001C2693C3|nr:protein ROS1A-like isoform X1 [Salvia splendens]